MDGLYCIRMEVTNDKWYHFALGLSRVKSLGDVTSFCFVVVIVIVIVIVIALRCDDIVVPNSTGRLPRPAGVHVPQRCVVVRGVGADTSTGGGDGAGVGRRQLGAGVAHAVQLLLLGCTLPPLAVQAADGQPGGVSLPRLSQFPNDAVECVAASHRQLGAAGSATGCGLCAPRTACSERSCASLGSTQALSFSAPVGRRFIASRRFVMMTVDSTKCVGPRPRQCTSQSKVSFFF